MPVDYGRLFEALPSAHMIIDRAYRYVAVNRAYEDVVATPREDLIGRRLFDVFPNDGESGKLLRASFARVFATGLPDTVAYIPYDIPRATPNGTVMEQRFWTATHQPLVDESGAVAYLIQNTADVTDIVKLRHAASLPFSVISGETRLLERAREAEAAHRSLMAESEDFRRIFQQAPGFIAVLSGPEHTFTFTNDAYMQLIDGRNALGLPVREALPDIAGQGLYELLDSVYQTGQPFSAEGMRVQLQSRPGEPPKEYFLDFSYDAIRDRDGVITGVFVQGMDRTESVRTQQKQKLLLDELNHRVKNTLATVQSIAAQTLRANADPLEARERFEARLRALSNAHNVLSEQHWGSAALSTILRQERGAYDDSRFTIDGDEVTLTPKASIAIALVIHELATNAAKHGALSSPAGRVAVRWTHDGGMLVIDWEETGGPPAAEPTRSGFGTRLVDRVVSGELGGSIEKGYSPSGFSCRIAIPAAGAEEGVA